MTRGTGPHSYVPRETRVLLRCPGCGATARATVRGGTVRNASLAHEDYCTWLTAMERGVPMAPVQIEIIKEDRP